MLNDLDETKLILLNQPVETLLASSTSIVSTWAGLGCGHTVSADVPDTGSRKLPGAAHPSAFKVLYQV